MTTVIMIILSIFAYLVIGKVFINVLVEFEVFDEKQDENLLSILIFFYPLYILIKLIIALIKLVNFVGDMLTKILFEKHKDDNVQKDERQMY